MHWFFAVSATVILASLKIFILLITCYVIVKIGISLFSYYLLKILPIKVIFICK